MRAILPSNLGHIPSLPNLKKPPVLSFTSREKLSLKTRSFFLCVFCALCVLRKKVFLQHSQLVKFVRGQCSHPDSLIAASADRVYNILLNAADQPFYIPYKD